MKRIEGVDGVEVEKETGEKTVEKKPFEFLVNAVLAIEKLRVAAQIRQTHLKLQGRADKETNELLKKIRDLEDYADGRVASLIKEHPAYHWFSQVKGIGKENIGKVIGLIDINKANTISGLWHFAGYHVENGKAPKRHKNGGKLSYNSRLRTMCWRLAGAITKAGIRQFCVECNTQRPVKREGEELVCGCGSTMFQSKPVSKFAEYYLKEKNKRLAKLIAQGVKIVPASQLPKDNGKRHETEGVISEGHIHNYVLRKMTKLFLACLWLVWREAVGLPTRQPYSAEYQGHTSIISPWEMVDK